MRYVVFLLAVLVSGTLQAQELKPLEDYETKTGYEAYPYERCAGLYAAVLDWSGSIKFSIKQVFEQEIHRLMGEASKLRYEDRADGFNRTKGFLDFMVLGTVGSFRSTYLLKMQTEINETQDLFGNKSLLGKDMAFCLKL